jgi:hypothetical protein
MFFNFKTAKLLIDLQKENDELKRGVGDIFMSLVEIPDQGRHYSLKNNNPDIGFIMDKIHKLKNKSKEGEESSCNNTKKFTEYRIIAQDIDGKKYVQEWNPINEKYNPEDECKDISEDMVVVLKTDTETLDFKHHIWNNFKRSIEYK